MGALAGFRYRDIVAANRPSNLGAFCGPSRASCPWLQLELDFGERAQVVVVAHAQPGATGVEYHRPRQLRPTSSPMSKYSQFGSPS
jgi:hypothetical protein